METPPPLPPDPYYTTEFVCINPDGSSKVRIRCTKPGAESEGIVIIENTSGVFQAAAKPTEQLDFKKAQLNIFARLSKRIVDVLRPQHRAEMSGAQDFLV